MFLLLYRRRGIPHTEHMLGTRYATLCTCGFFVFHRVSSTTTASWDSRSGTGQSWMKPAFGLGSLSSVRLLMPLYPIVPPFVLPIPTAPSGAHKGAQDCPGVHMCTHFTVMGSREGPHSPASWAREHSLLYG